MEFFEGYNYRINIVGADSSIIVDSSTGLIRGSIADVDENIIVDTFNSTFHGTLIGNIIDQDLNVVLDISEKTINLKSVVAETIKGNIINKNDDVVFDAFHNTIRNIDQIQTTEIISKSIFGDLKGNIINKNDDFVFDSDNNVIRISSIEGINNILNFNSALYPGDVEFYIDTSLSINSTVRPLGEPQTSISVRYQRNSLDSPEDVKGGDGVGLFTAEAYYNYDYKPVGAMAFIVDPELKEDEEIDFIPSYFIVTPHSRDLDMNLAAHEINTEHPIFKESLTFGKRTLSAPIVKVGAHNSTDEIKAEKGMIIFNDATGKFQGYTGTEWVNLH